MIQKMGHDYQHLCSMCKDPIHVSHKTHLEFYQSMTNFHSPDTNITENTHTHTQASKHVCSTKFKKKKKRSKGENHKICKNISSKIFLKSRQQNLSPSSQKKSQFLMGPPSERYARAMKSLKKKLPRIDEKETRENKEEVLF